MPILNLPWLLFPRADAKLSCLPRDQTFQCISAFESTGARVELAPSTSQRARSAALAERLATDD